MQGLQAALESEGDNFESDEQAMTQWLTSYYYYYYYYYY